MYFTSAMETTLVSESDADNIDDNIDYNDTENILEEGDVDASLA